MADGTAKLGKSSIALVSISAFQANSSTVQVEAASHAILSFNDLTSTGPVSVSASVLTSAALSAYRSSITINTTMNQTVMTKTDLPSTNDSRLSRPSSSKLQAPDLSSNFSLVNGSASSPKSTRNMSEYTTIKPTLFGHLPAASNIAMLKNSSIYATSVRSGSDPMSDYRSLKYKVFPVPQPNNTLKHTSPGLTSGFRPGSFINSSTSLNHARSTGAIPASITALPKPTGYLNGTPLWPLNATLPPQLDYGIMPLIHGGACTMGMTCSGCTNYNAQSCSCANSVSKWYYGHNRTTITTRLCTSILIGPIPGSTQPMTCSMGTTVSIAVPYDAPKAHCCDKCDIRADEVQLLFWPDTGASKISESHGALTLTASTLERNGLEGSKLVSDGYTYMSPSVYISYKNLQAAVSCVTTMIAASAWSPMGPALTTIRPYEAKALSTAKCFAPRQDGMNLGYFNSSDNSFLSGIFNGWDAVDYQDFISIPPEEKVISRYQTCFPQLTTRLGVDIAMNMYTAPRLSIPGDVTDIDPLWKSWGRGTCTPIGLGAADPPQVLRTKTAMLSLSASPTVSANAGSGVTSVVSALPAAAPTDGVTAIRTSMDAIESPMTGIENPDQILDSDSTKTSAFLATSITPIIDPVSTLDPNDPGLEGNGKSSAPNLPNPIYESAATNQGPSPSSPAVLPANVGASWPATTQVAQMPDNLQQAPPSPSQVLTFPPNIQMPDAASVANPNSVPITLSPVSPAKVQIAPNSPPSGIAPFIAQGFSGEPVQPVAPPDSQTNNKDPPAPAFEPGEPEQGSSITNPPETSTERDVPIANLLLGSPQVVQSVNGELQVGDQTLQFGSQTTISGHTVDYPNPSSLVVDRTTYSVSPISDSNPLIIDNQPVQRRTSGALAVAGTTIQPNQQATISGHVYSLAGTSDVVVDQSTYLLPPTENAFLIQAQQTPTPPIPQNTPVALGNGIVITPQIAPSNPTSNPVFGFPNGEVISNGGPPIVVSGNTYSVLPSNQGFLVNGVSTLAIPIPSLTTPPTLHINSETVTPAPTGFLVGGASILPGAPAVTISGTPISLDESSHLYVGSSVIALSMTPSLSVFTAGSQTITPKPGGFAIGSTSISPGGPAVTVSGTVLSLDLSSHLRIGSSTMTLNSGTLSDSLIFTAGALTFSANPTGFTVGSATILPDGPATTIDGTVISLDASSHLYIGSSVATLPSQPTSILTGSTMATLASPSQTASIFTIGTQTFTANPNGFQIAGTTLTPGGPAATVSGITVSLAQNGNLDIGSSTISFLPQIDYLSTMRGGILTTVKVSGYQTKLASGLAQADLGSPVASETSNIATAGLIKGTGIVADKHKSIARKEGRWGLWIMTVFWSSFVVFSIWIL